MAFYPKNKRGFKPRAKKFVKRTTKRNSSLVKMVQKIIRKDAETKQAFTNQVSQIQNYNSGINSSADVGLLMPAITLGTADNARIGDQIRGQSLTIKGHFISRFANAAGSTYFNSCRIGVRMFIVSPKSFPSQGQAVGNAATWLNILLRKGGLSTGFTGLISDLYAPVNTDAITCYYDKTFYVQNPYSNSLVASDSTNLMPVGTTKFFTKVIKLKNSLIKYDSAIDSGTTPVSGNKFILLGYSYLDGTSADSVTTQIGMSFTSCLRYEDM